MQVVSYSRDKNIYINMIIAKLMLMILENKDTLTNFYIIFNLSNNYIFFHFIIFSYIKKYFLIILIKY